MRSRAETQGRSDSERHEWVGLMHKGQSTESQAGCYCLSHSSTRCALQGIGSGLCKKLYVRVQ